jgi:hypothetical protein
VRLTPRDGLTLRSLSITIGSRKITRRPAPRSLMVRTLPQGTFSLTARVTISQHRHVSRTRRYHSCAT